VVFSEVERFQTNELAEEVLELGGSDRFYDPGLVLFGVDM